MWPSVRSRLPACFTESFRTSLYLGDTEREKKKRKKNEKPLENLACIVQPEPSASVTINFAAAAASLRDVPIRCVSTAYPDTTPLSSAVAPSSEDELIIVDTPASSSTFTHRTKSHSIPIKTKTVPEHIKTRTVPEPEKEVKYSETLEFLLKTNFQSKPTTSSADIVERRASSPEPQTASEQDDDEPGLEQLLTGTTRKQQKSRSGKISKTQEIRKARRRELNKVHAKNYRIKIKAEKDEIQKAVQELEERNFELKKKVQEMEEKKEWLTSYVNMAVKKKSEELRVAEAERQREEERQQEAKRLTEDDLGLSLDIDELFNSILTSQGSFMEVMEIE